VNRPSPVELLKGINPKARKDQSIHNTHMKQGYTLKEIAYHLNIHYTTISKVITKGDRG
jgi:hypothetical protein